MTAVAESVDVRLPEGAAAPTGARAAVSAHFSDHLDSARLAELLVLTSEVVTNAVLHAGTAGEQGVGLRLTRRAGIARVAVTDRGPESAPRIMPLDPLEPGGLGLLLVEELSERWGVERRDAATKEVWFEFLITAPPDGPLVGERAAHVECPDCGLRIYTVDAWTTLDRCPRCRTALTRSLYSAASASPGRDGGGRGPG